MALVNIGDVVDAYRLQFGSDAKVSIEMEERDGVVLAVEVGGEVVRRASMGSSGYRWIIFGPESEAVSQ